MKKSAKPDLPDIFDPSQRGGFGDTADQLAEAEEGKADPFANAPPLDKLRRWYREAFNAADAARTAAFRDADYFHGEGQLSAKIKAEMARRRQPPAYWNKIRPGVQGVLGLLDSGQTDPEAIGRNDNDEDAALVVTKILRYLADKNDLEETKRHASFDLLVHGIGASVTEVSENGDARVSAIPFNEFFYDPFSLRHDFLDARFMGRAKWVDAKIAQRMFPDRYLALGNPFDSVWDGQGPEDTPELKAMWLDTARRRILLVEIYYQDDQTGQWQHAMFCHAGILDFAVSDYKDDEGNSACPITAVSYEVDRMGNRYGMIRDMVPLQDSINARLSRMLHLTNSAQVEAYDDNALPVDRETARKEASKADGAMPRGWRRVPVQDIFEGNHILLLNDIEAIERMAPSPALLGRAGGANESGRARQVLQQAGLTELARAFARWENWELRTYKQMWFRSLQYMSEPRMIRVTNDAGARESLHVNYPIMKTALAPVVDPSTGQPAIDPQTGQPHMAQQQVQAGTHNELAQMDMEITLKTVRQADSLRQEAIDSMLEFAAKTGTSILSPDFELVIEMSEIPNKQWLLETYNRLKAQNDQANAAQVQAQQQQAQQIQEITAASAQSKIERDHAQAVRDQMLAEKHDVEAQDKAFDLGVKKLELKHFIQAAAGSTPPQNPLF